MAITRRVFTFLLAITVAVAMGCGYFTSAMGDEDGSETPDITIEEEVYTPCDLTDYTEWDGKSKLTEGGSYYIGAKTKLTKQMTLPADTTLVIPENTKFIVYSSGSLINRGKLIIEKNAELFVSGRFTASADSTTSLYGSMSMSKSSATALKSIVIIREGGSFKASGNVTIYKKGQLLNFGYLNFTKSSVLKVTGEIITGVDAKMVLLSENAVITLSGRLTAAGYFNLAGTSSLTNSGIIVFEKTIKYFKSGTITATRSSKLIDYRFKKLGDENYDDIGSSDGNEDFDETVAVSLKGIDVSYHQGVIDWTKVKDSGIEFAMIRASRGYISKKKPMTADTMFAANITGALAAGIKVGVYHYSYAHTVEEAIEEANFFIDTISSYSITYPVVLDLEEDSQAKLGKDKLTAIAVAFMETVKNAGYTPMLYSNKYWLTAHYDMTRLTDYDVWLAQWSSAPTYSGTFGIWQYSATGVVSGINGYVDLNISYRDYDKITKKYGGNNYTELRQTA